MRPVSFRNRPRRGSMFDEHRLGNDGTEATLPRPRDDGDRDDQTDQNDDDIAGFWHCIKTGKNTCFGPISNSPWTSRQVAFFCTIRTREFSSAAPCTMNKSPS